MYTVVHNCGWQCVATVFLIKFVSVRKGSIKVAALENTSKIY